MAWRTSSSSTTTRWMDKNESLLHSEGDYTKESEERIIWRASLLLFIVIVALEGYLHRAAIS